MSDEEARIEDERRAEWATFERKSARLFLRLGEDPGAYAHLKGTWMGHTADLRATKRPDGTVRVAREIVLLGAAVMPGGACPGCGRPLMP
jgi:hypothetical protein